MSSESSQAPSWKVAAVAMAAILVVAVGVLAMLGSQVSGVLSTVGASVGAPGTVSGGSGSNAGGDSSGVGDSDGGGGASGGEGASGGGSDGGTAGGNGAASGADVLLDVTRPELLVIKTGEITVQVGDIDSAVSAATTAIDGLGGYVSGTSRSGTGDEASAAVTFRIPAGAWDGALTAVRGLGGTILDEHSETDDVTGKVVDLDAHVRNLQTTESALASIMSKATTIKDVLSVQDELTDVRGEIEALQSEASHLREQAAFSTLTLNVRHTAAPVVAKQERQFEPKSEADAATAYLVKIAQKLAKAGIWVGIVWLPVLLGIGLGGGIGLFLYRRFRRATAAA